MQNLVHAPARLRHGKLCSQAHFIHGGHLGELEHLHRLCRTHIPAPQAGSETSRLIRAKHVCTHQSPTASVRGKLRGGGVREVRGVHGTLAGFVERFGGLRRAGSRKPAWGFGELSGVWLPSALFLWVRQASAYPRGRTHREVYAVHICTHTILLQLKLATEGQGPYKSRTAAEGEHLSPENPGCP